MREIRFRGYAVEEMVNSQWLYGSGIHVVEFTDEYTKETGKKDEVFLFTDSSWVEVVKESVGQFIGLKDSSDHEIYEGDVVEGEATASEGGFNFKGHIVFYEQNNVHGWYVEDEDGAAWEMKQLATRFSLDHINGEVIGNIHENP